MNCPHCRAPNSDEARFCGSCGRATSATEPQSNPNLGEAPAVIGREIAGRYRILAKLGEGGMGAVYKAEQISLKRTVAVKLLRPEVASSPVLLRRFNAEATAVAKLSHPNTVNIYDFGQDADGTLFIAMEYIDGASLRSVIQRDAPLSLRRALAIAAQVATSLTDAHAHGLVHRDLKPDNVMLQDRAKDRDVARVLDFGIAKLRDDRQSQMAMTQAGDMLGTPQYMAPEQIRGEPIDGRTDVYALGCMLYEMVTGRMPYEAATVMALLSKHLLEVTVAPSQRRPDLQLPPAIDQLILGAMAKDPKVRPPTMEQFGDQIERLLATLPADSASHAAQPSSAYRTAEPVLTPMAPSAYAGPAAGVAAGAAAGAPAAPPPAAPAAYAAPSPYAGPPGAAAPTEPPFAPPAPPPMAAPYPPHAQTLTTRGANTGLWIVLVVIALAGAGIAAFFVLRDSSTAADGGRDPWAKSGSGSGSQTVAATTGTTGTTDPPPTPEARPTNVTDPWAVQPTTGSGGDPDDDADDDSPATGTFRRTVQGVRIRVPSGFRVTLATAQRFVASHPSGVEIGVFAITSTSNDVPTLAREYAALSGLTLIEVTPQPVGGHPGYVATYQGVFNGGPVTQAVTPLLGARHRVAVLIHVPDSTIQAAPQAVEAAGYVLVNGIQLP